MGLSNEERVEKMITSLHLIHGAMRKRRKYVESRHSLTGLDEVIAHASTAYEVLRTKLGNTSYWIVGGDLGDTHVNYATLYGEAEYSAVAEAIKVDKEFVARGRGEQAIYKQANEFMEALRDRTIFVRSDHSFEIELVMSIGQATELFFYGYNRYHGDGLCKEYDELAKWMATMSGLTAYCIRENAEFGVNWLCKKLVELAINGQFWHWRRGEKVPAEFAAFLHMHPSSIEVQLSDARRFGEMVGRLSKLEKLGPQDRFDALAALFANALAAGRSYEAELRKRAGKIKLDALDRQLDLARKNKAGAETKYVPSKRWCHISDYLLDNISAYNDMQDS